MSKSELDRLRADLGNAALDGAIAANDPASFDLVGWAAANGYAITAADLPAASALEGPLDDETLDGMAGGNVLQLLQMLRERAANTPSTSLPSRPPKTTEPA